jgi:1-deoxy-D-xylulose-5-phosphate reductoisomerase
MQSAKKRGTSCAVLTAANDIAVDAFLDNKLAYDQIPVVIEKVLKKHKFIKNPEIEDILAVDTWSRKIAIDLIND